MQPLKIVEITGDKCKFSAIWQRERSNETAEEFTVG